MDIPSIYAKFRNFGHPFILVLDWYLYLHYMSIDRLFCNNHLNLTVVNFYMMCQPSLTHHSLQKNIWKKLAYSMYKYHQETFTTTINTICKKIHIKYIAQHDTNVIVSIDWFGLCCLMPLSTIFQLYRLSWVRTHNLSDDRRWLHR